MPPEPESAEQHGTHVGAGLLANAVGQPPSSLNDTPLSRASSLPQWIGVELKTGLQERTYASGSIRID
ncbi:hypothetical protein E3Z29_18870 [Pseudomonas sp. S150]|nr:hypothetical protein E3Z29_18870 [Pseudomonas sp. S150]